jgi:hypothetical protein
MAGPEASVPDDVVSEALARFRRLVDEIYQAGYEQGDRDAIARILQAARPSANGQVPTKRSVVAGDGPGAATHELIEHVLHARSPATPAEISRAPWNQGDNAISRQAIAKVLRRGSKPGGRYVKAGPGRYALRVGAIK